MYNDDVHEGIVGIDVVVLDVVDVVISAGIILFEVLKPFSLSFGVSIVTSNGE